MLSIYGNIQQLSSSRADHHTVQCLEPRDRIKYDLAAFIILPDLPKLESTQINDFPTVSQMKSRIVGFIAILRKLNTQAEQNGPLT